MDKAAEVSQPRVIAQTKDFHENEYRLVWRPPTPADHPDGDGEPTQGHLIIEQRGEDALGEPAWRGSRVDPLAECDHGGLYALIVKLHTAYETAWDQRESIAAHSHDLFRFPTIDIEAVGCAASDIQSAYGSLAFAPPEGYRIHIVRMCDAIQELANALGLKPPSELSPPVAIMIAAARAFVHGGSFDDDDIEATDLVAAVKAYEAQT